MVSVWVDQISLRVLCHNPDRFGMNVTVERALKNPKGNASLFYELISLVKCVEKSSIVILISIELLVFAIDLYCF